MAKPSRKERQEAKARALRARKPTRSTIAQAFALAAVMTVVTAVAVPAEAHVEPAAVQTTADEVPPSGSMARSDELPPIISVREIDAQRLLDHRLQPFVAWGILPAYEMAKAMYFVRMQDFLRHMSLVHDHSRALDFQRHMRRLAFVGGHWLFDPDGNVLPVGHQLWEAFRLRNRREGAIQRICDNQIIESRPGYRPRYMRRAA